MRVLLFASALVLASCASRPDHSDAYATLVYVVRHAETQDDGTRDPGLSDEGEARAIRLVSHTGVELDAVFVSPLQRAQQTAAFAASRSGVTPSVVPIGAGGVEAHVAQTVDAVRALPHGSTVLVVGHSNTAPAIAEALVRRGAGEIAENDYGTLYVLTLPFSDGPGTLLRRTY